MSTASAAIAHHDDRPPLLLGRATFPTDTEDDNQENDDNQWQCKAENQSQYQPQLWTVVDVADVAQFLNKVSKSYLQQISTAK